MKTPSDLNDALLAEAKTLTAQQPTSLMRSVGEGLQTCLRAKRTPTHAVRLPIYRGKGDLASGLSGLSNKALLEAAQLQSESPA